MDDQIIIDMYFACDLDSVVKLQGHFRVLQYPVYAVAEKLPSGKADYCMGKHEARTVHAEYDYNNGGQSVFYNNLLRTCRLCPVETKAKGHCFYDENRALVNDASRQCQLNIGLYAGC